MTWVSGVDSVSLVGDEGVVNVAVASADDEVGPNVVVSYEGSVEVSAGFLFLIVEVIDFVESFDDLA